MNFITYDVVTEFRKSIVMCIIISVFCSAPLFPIILSSRSLIHSYASSSPLFIASSLFPISFIELFISDSFLLFYRCGKGLTDIFCPASILMIIALNSPSGMLLISVLPYLVFIWDKFLCLDILSKTLPSSVC